MKYYSKTKVLFYKTLVDSTLKYMLPTALLSKYSKGAPLESETGMTVSIRPVTLAD